MVRATNAQAARGAGASSPAPKEAQPASMEHMAAIRHIAQVVVRLFYDDGHVILMDQLVTAAVIPSEILSRRVGLQARDLAALAAKLVEDRMVSIYRTQETKDGVMARPFSRTYYYLDYKNFLDVLKWRMLAMRRHIDTKLRNGLDNKGYVCPRCRSSYSTLEVAHLLDMRRNVFVCDVPGCGTELVDNEDAEDVRKSKDTLKRFNEQLDVVQSALRRVEGVALPQYVGGALPADDSMDIHAWLAKHANTSPWLEKTEPSLNKQIPALPDLPPPTQPQAPAVRVELAGGDPTLELEKQQQRAREEESQRAQNTLPAWHLASTISGERTGLGRGDAAQRPAAVAEAAGEAAGDGVAGADDADYYARFAEQLQGGIDTNPAAQSSAREGDAGRRAVRHEAPDAAARPEKRARTDGRDAALVVEEDDDLDDMEDVI
ncbi:hypothetical protein MSPP1_001848 [Malassezia sp. CBS 17886]|nr:hypothetical protein MSPP1_001848 [Malassezia sp. CBS 17886]